MPDTDAVGFDLVQPSAWRREWQLVSAGEVRARLRMPAIHGAPSLELAGRALLVERHERVRPDRVLRDPETGEVLATLHSEGRRLLLEQPAGAYEWKRLEQKGWYGFVDPAAGPVVRARIRSGLRTTGSVEVERVLSGTDALVAALLACLLLIRKRDETTAVGAAVAGGA